MNGYIRCREVSSDLWPYPKDQGFMSVEFLDKNKAKKGMTVLYRECFIPTQEVVDGIVKMLLAKGWKPPGGSDV